MSAIVLHIRTGKRYALVGTGFGAFQSKKPNWLLGDLMADTTEGQYAMACVSDSDGSIYWLDSSEIKLDTIDGRSPAAILDEAL